MTLRQAAIGEAPVRRAIVCGERAGRAFIPSPSDYRARPASAGKRIAVDGIEEFRDGLAMMAKSSKRFQILLFGSVMLVFSGCERPKVASSPTASASPVAPSPSVASTIETARVTDACALLTSQEIESVLGEPLKETKGNVNADGAFAMAQCYFSLPTPANSVHVSVNQKGNGGAAREPKQFWEETFHHEKENDGDEKEEKKSKPTKVDGVGDEAYWSGNSIGGALYVLKGNAFIRISVGGPGDQDAKIKKCRALAESILKRI